MQILSILPSTKEIIFVILEENSKYKYHSYKINNDIPIEDNIFSLYTYLSTYFTENVFDLVAVIKAAPSKFGNSSFVRVKFESIIQLVCKKSNLHCLMIPKISVTTYISKQDKDLNEILETEGNISPKKIIDLLWLSLLAKDQS
jgi:hypothetical protein